MKGAVSKTFEMAPFFHEYKSISFFYMASMNLLGTGDRISYIQFIYGEGVVHLAKKKL